MWQTRGNKNRVKPRQCIVSAGQIVFVLHKKPGVQRLFHKTRHCNWFQYNTIALNFCLQNSATTVVWKSKSNMLYCCPSMCLDPGQRRGKVGNMGVGRGLQWKVILFKTQSRKMRLLYRKEAGVRVVRLLDAYVTHWVDLTSREKGQADEKKVLKHLALLPFNTVRSNSCSSRNCHLYPDYFSQCNGKCFEDIVLFGDLNLLQWIALHLHLWEREQKSGRAPARVFCLSQLWRGRWIPL